MKKNYSILLFIICFCNLISNAAPGFFVSLQLHKDSAPANETDETIVYFNQTGATDGFDPFADASTLGSSTVSTIFSVVADNTGGLHYLAINSMGTFNSDRVVDISVLIIGAAGPCTITGLNFSQFSGTSTLLLEDQVLNVFQDLRQDSVYEVTLPSGVVSNRFRLHLGPPAQIATPPAGCQSGSLLLVNNSNLPVSYSIFDQTNTQVSSGLNFTDSIELPFSFGTYTTYFTRDQYADTIVTEIVPGVNAISANLSSSLSVVDIASNEPVNFSLDITGTYTSISWNFGDNTTASDSISISHLFTQEGTFNVMVLLDNGICSYTTEIPITVTNITNIYTSPKKSGYFQFNGLQNNKLVFENSSNSQYINLELFSIDGKKLSSENFSLINGLNYLDIPVTVSQGIFLVNVKTQNIQQSFKIALIEN